MDYAYANLIVFNGNKFIFVKVIYCCLIELFVLKEHFKVIMAQFCIFIL